MKRIFSTIFLSSLTLLAEASSPCNPCEEAPFLPFSLSGLALSVANTDFRTADVEGQHLKYAQANAAFGFTYPFNPCWGLIFGAGWVGTEVKWKENPAFRETHFSYVNLSFGAFTKSMPDWTWSLTGTALMDTAVLDLTHYALYQGVLTGKYELSEELLLDVGFILEVGLNKGKIWPVLGIEYAPCDKWSLNIVYPIDISFEYMFLPRLSAGASIRFLRDRHRVKESNPLPMGIYEYRTMGGEFDLTYTYSPYFYIQGFVGSTLKGDLKITDQNNHHATHFKFKSSLYGGVNAALTF